MKIVLEGKIYATASDTRKSIEIDLSKNFRIERFERADHLTRITVDDFIYYFETDSIKYYTPIESYALECKKFIGATIKDFFCNGFFGSRTFDLGGAEIINLYSNVDEIVMEVEKTNGIHEVAYFNDGWNNWETVYDYLVEWTKKEEE